MTQFEQFMVTLPKPFDCRASVCADGAVEAVRQALADTLGVPAHEVQATPRAGYGAAKMNQVWIFSYGDEAWLWNPVRVAKRPNSAVELSRFIGAPQLPFMEA